MYVVVSYTRAHGRVIRPGLSLVAAYRLIERLGHGAVFRAEGMSPYSRPVYPRLPHRQAGVTPANRAIAAASASASVFSDMPAVAVCAARPVVRHEGSLV